MKKTDYIFIKKNIQKALLLFALVMVHSSFTRAQITLTTADMPSPGDTIRKSTALNPNQIDYTLTGTNYTWDFTSLFSIGQTVDTFVSVSSVPFWYQIVFIPNLIANLAQKYPEIDTIPELQLSLIHI